MSTPTLSAAQASVTALFTLAKGATAAAIDHKLKSKLIEIQAGILNAQSQLGDAQAERLELLDKVAKLTAEIQALKKSHNDLESYVLHDAGWGKFLYKYKTEIEGSVAHFACPTCHNAGKISVLQSSKTGAAQMHYACETCKLRIYVGPSDPPVRIPRRSSTWTGS